MLCCGFVGRGVKYVVLPLVFFYFLLAISRDPGDREPSHMVMGARPGAAIREMFSKDFPSISSYYWTDSTICLHWLFSVKQLPVFIRNRATEILRLTDLSSWSHVQGTQSHSGSLQDLIDISCFQSYEPVL